MVGLRGGGRGRRKASVPSCYSGSCCSGGGFVASDDRRHGARVCRGSGAACGRDAVRTGQAGCLPRPLLLPELSRCPNCRVVIPDEIGTGGIAHKTRCRFLDSQDRASAGMQYLEGEVVRLSPLSIELLRVAENDGLHGG